MGHGSMHTEAAAPPPEPSEGQAADKWSRRLRSAPGRQRSGARYTRTYTVIPKKRADQQSRKEQGDRAEQPLG